MDRQVFHAAHYGNISEIERLYTERPELLSEVTFKKSNVLHIAARGGHSDIVKWILYHMKDSSMCIARNSYLNTPLHEAAEAGNADLVGIFISHGRSVISLFLRGRSYWVNMFGETPLLIACRNGHKEAAAALLENSKPNHLRSPKYQPCLHVAACGRHLDVVRLLLSKTNMEKFGEVWMMPDAHGATPLHAAIYGGHIDIVQELLNVDLRISWRKWLMTRTSWREWLMTRTSWREWLMTKEDSDGNCGIHAAILEGNCEIIKYLSSTMPDCIEIRNKDGNTALHLAAQNAVDRKVVECLVKLPGVNVNAVNKKGLTPLDIAVTASNKNSASDIILILEEHGASANYKLQSNHKEVPNDVTGCVSTENGKEETESKVMDVDTLLASLIATVTFAAIFQVPGGTDDNGLARRTFEPFFTIFLVSDTVALFTSLFVVIGWIFGERLQKRRADTNSMYTILSDLCLGISIASTACVFMSAAFLVIIPPDVKALRHGHKEAFHKYYRLYLLVVYLSIIPMAFVIIAQLLRLGLKRGGRTWRENAAMVMLFGMEAMFGFFCVYQSVVQRELWGKSPE